MVDSNPFINKRYFDAFIKLKEDYNAVSIGLVIDDKVHKNPDSDYKIKTGDYFILISDGTGKKSLENAFRVKEGA